MDNLYATIGKQSVALEELNAQYDSLLAVLGKVAAGDVKPEHIQVNMAARSWNLNIQPVPLKVVEDSEAAS